MSSRPRDSHQVLSALTPEAKEALRHLEMQARRMVDGILHGIHRSRRIGVSTDFDHHKLYIPGDQLKHIDWKVSARHDKYYVKRYLEETALSTQIVVDRSASMVMETEENPSKYECATRVAAAMAYLILKQKDGVGLALPGGDGTTWLPVRFAEVHLVRILEALVSQPPEGADTLDACLRAVVDRGGRRGLVVLISDLMFPPEAVQRELAKLQAGGNEVLIFQIRDETEEEFPFSRWVEFRDLEDSNVRRRLDTVPLRQIYLEEYQAVHEEWRAWSKKYDIHFVGLRAESAVETAISEYLAFRAGKAVK